MTKLRTGHGTPDTTDTTDTPLWQNCQKVSKPCLNPRVKHGFVNNVVKHGFCQFTTPVTAESRGFTRKYSENTEISPKTRVLAGWSKTSKIRPWVRYMKHVVFEVGIRTTFRTLFDHFLTLFATFRHFSVFSDISDKNHENALKHHVTRGVKTCENPSFTPN